jgi:hypothetical protein
MKKKRYNKQWTHYAVRFSDDPEFKTWHREIPVGWGRVGWLVANVVAHCFWFGNYYAIVKYKF